MKNLVFIVYRETFINNREEMVPMSEAGFISYWKNSKSAREVAGRMDCIAPVRKSDLPDIARAYGLEVEDERIANGRSPDPVRPGAAGPTRREGDS